MKLLTDHNQLAIEFAALCNQYDHYKWAVAWAGKESGFDLAKILKKNKNKVERLIVGLHFCQTDPLFIKHYMDHPTVRFIKQTEGVFHPKMYFFYNSSDDWAAIVGSSNFTFSAFNVNREANVYFCQDDGEGLFEQLNEYIDCLWEEAGVISAPELVLYERIYKHQKSNLESLHKPIVNNKSGRIDISEIDVMTWDSYMSSILKDDMTTLEPRITLLNKAQELFRKYPTFNEIPLEYKRCLAGFAMIMPGLENVDWRLFGSMQGARQYKKAINAGTSVANAIDKIPLTGEVTKEMFYQYVRVFKKISINPLASATRLLAIKRPDTFICIDSKNKKNLCKAFNIPQSHLTLDTYWELIVERIRKMIWYSEAPKGGAQERKIKKYQVAMLDNFYYENV